MAERRMFAKTIIESDAFGALSKDAQNLYLHLGMNADDDGFLNNAKHITMAHGMKPAVLEELINARFLIRFPSGVVVIKHWKINNYIQKDRYKKTIYSEEMACLRVKENGAYTEDAEKLDTEWIHNSGYSLDTQVRLGKDSIGKDIKDIGHGVSKTFTKPTLEQIKAYCLERKNKVSADAFFNYYESNGWKVGKNSMKDWKAAVRTWEHNDYGSKPKEQKAVNKFGAFQNDNRNDLDALARRLTAN